MITDALSNIISSGIGTAGSIFSTVMGAGLSARQAKRQYNYQRKLNQQAYDLTQRGYRESYGNMRQGLVDAGYNPVLAVNANPYTGYSGGSAGSFQSGVDDFSDSAVNAYKAFKLDKEVTDATIEKLKAETENIREDTALKPFDKPLKLVGDILKNPDVPKSVVKDVVGEVVTPKVNNAKSFASRKFWNWYDYVNDKATWFKWNAKNVGLNRTDWIEPKYFNGVSKTYRIQKGIYNHNQLRYKPHIH